MQVEITYEYLRGTRDDGFYTGPSRVLINKRRMREVCAAHPCDVGACSALHLGLQYCHDPFVHMMADWVNAGHAGCWSLWSVQLHLTSGKQIYAVSPNDSAY